MHHTVKSIPIKRSNNSFLDAHVLLTVAHPTLTAAVDEGREWGAQPCTLTPLALPSGQSMLFYTFPVLCWFVSASWTAPCHPFCLSVLAARLRPSSQGPGGISPMETSLMYLLTVSPRFTHPPSHQRQSSLQLTVSSSPTDRSPSAQQSTGNKENQMQGFTN